MITLGKYRHYKGKEYEVLNVARHSETLEERVVIKKARFLRTELPRPNERHNGYDCPSDL